MYYGPVNSVKVILSLFTNSHFPKRPTQYFVHIHSTVSNNCRKRANDRRNNFMSNNQYENTPIQIYLKFHAQKLSFQIRSSNIFFIFLLKT